MFVPPRLRAGSATIVLALALMIFALVYAGVVHRHVKRPNVPPVHQLE
ncbi:MAG TPA: hypothetical protein VJO35_05460 [Terriglobales bacterium]|nr:hypothetical protein [Terriglobales bacterium]